MSQKGPYSIYCPDKKQYSVSFEVWLLHRVWQDPNFVQRSYRELREALREQGLNIPDKLQSHVKLKIILLKNYTGVTIITPMKVKSVETAKYLNDIWTNDRMITWVMSSDVKYFILALRKKSFDGLKKSIQLYGPSRASTANKSISLTDSEKASLDWNDLDNWSYLTDSEFHTNLKKDSSYLATHMDYTHHVQFPDRMGQFGYLNQSNELIFVIPEIKHPSYKDHFDDYLAYLLKIADTQIDVLTSETGNVTLIWSKNISDQVKTVRKQISTKTEI